MKKIILSAAWMPQNITSIVQSAVPDLQITSSEMEASGGTVSCAITADRELTSTEMDAVRAGYHAALPEITSVEI